MKTNQQKPSYLKRKAYFLVTLFLFLASVALHWHFGWKDYVNEQMAHSQPALVPEYAVQMMRETMENWQSEFLQLIWQVVGLSFLWYCGSPQSKEGDDRREEKLDFIIKHLEPGKAEELLEQWKIKYPDK